MEFPRTTGEQFLAISAVLTGHSEVDLRATGMAGAFWETLVSTVGTANAGDFLATCARAFAASGGLDELEANMDEMVMGDGQCRPLAQNIISLWYLGQWNQLPPDWSDQYGASTRDQTHVVSSRAYVESLVWPTFGAHPMGAKPPGFGSWAEPPLRMVNTDPPQPPLRTVNMDPPSR